MSTPYKVGPGDTLNSIAQKNGIASGQEIYNHPDNAAFRAKRPNPNQIYAGDTVMIPTKSPAKPSGGQFWPGYLPGGNTEVKEVKMVFSTGSMSWIDPRIPLPEADFGGNPGLLATNRATLTGKTKYRFANFLEAFINVNSSGTIVGHGFTNESGLYGNPSSFLGTSPQSFNVIRSAQIGQEPIRFVQIVGARTNASEVIMEALARQVGRSFAAINFGLPPIWSEIELSVFSTGATSARILRHSLFPSLEWYTQDTFGHLGHVPNLDAYFNRYNFDARPNLARWIDDGWGNLTTAQAARTPSPGNPWNIPKPSRRPGSNILFP
jgi:hypothetical protein